MADTVYGEFMKKVKKSSSAADKDYNLRLLYGIVKNHPMAITAPIPGKSAYLLFTKGKTEHGRIALRVTDDNKAVYGATMLPPRNDGTIPDKGQDFFGDATKETDFMQSLEKAFSW